MAAGLSGRRGETASHSRLKRLAMIWAQAHDYSACALEVHLPHCRFRADVAAFRERREGDTTAIFECKQALSDLRRDNCESVVTRKRLDAVEMRREVIERNLRIHYPTLRTGSSLFPDFDSFDFSRLDHRGYGGVARDAAALRQRLSSCTKFEKLARYHCANLFYLVIAAPMQATVFELPPGWGVLVETGDVFDLVQKPVWHEVGPENKTRFLRRIAAAGTRAINRQLAIHPDAIDLARRNAI
jgi:hypothetical protein